jgi:hypothetical protein
MAPDDALAAGHAINRLWEYPALTTFHKTLLYSSEKLALVSTKPGEDHSRSDQGGGGGGG